MDEIRDQSDERDSRLAVLTGTVCSQTTRERSTVSGWGGGGHISRGQGQIRDVSIETRHETIREIWLRDREGSEHHVNLHTNPYFDPSMREGHRITIITFEGHIWALLNHATGKTAWAVTADALAGPMPKVPWRHTFGAVFAVAFLVPTLCVLTRNSNGIVPFGSLGILGILVLVSVRNRATAKAWHSRMSRWRDLTRQASMLLVHEERAN